MNRWTYRQRDPPFPQKEVKKLEIYNDIGFYMDGQTDGGTDGEKDRQMDSQMDVETYRQRERPPLLLKITVSNYKGFGSYSKPSL